MCACSSSRRVGDDELALVGGRKAYARSMVMPVALAAEPVHSSAKSRSRLRAALESPRGRELVSKIIFESYRTAAERGLAVVHRCTSEKRRGSLCLAPAVTALDVLQSDRDVGH